MGETGYTAPSRGFGRGRDFSALFAPAGKHDVDYIPTIPISEPGLEDPAEVLEASILREDNGRSGEGSSLNFDPSRAATNLTEAEIAAGFIPGVEGRVTDSLTQSAIDALKSNAAMMGLVGQMGGQVNPGDLLNPQSLLTAIPNAMMEAAGVESEGILGGITENALPMLGSMLLGPGTGLAAGILGPVVGDALSDLTGFRDIDEARDKLEDASGELRGRRQWRTIKDRFQPSNLRYAEEEGDFGLAAQRAAEQTQLAQNKPFTNVDLIQDQMNKSDAFGMAQALIDYADPAKLLARQQQQEVERQAEIARQQEAARQAEIARQQAEAERQAAERMRQATLRYQGGGGGFVSGGGGFRGSAGGYDGGSSHSAGNTAESRNSPMGL